jgi:putative phosphoesterase
MKIGLISDIHGEIAALEQALELFTRLRVTTILCAGDIVDRGKPHNARVMRCLQTQHIPVVRGNHDLWVAEYQRELRVQQAFTHAEWLDDDDLDALDMLPDEWRGTFEDQQLYMTHASPGDVERGLTYKEPLLADEICAHAQANYVILGHTHQAMFWRCGQTLLLNPGALWSHFDDDYGTCATLTLPEGIFQLYSLRNMMSMGWMR